MTGIVKSSLPDAQNLSAIQALQLAADMKLSGVFFGSLFDISPELDQAELAAFRDKSKELGLNASVMLGFLNPALPFRSEAVSKLANGNLDKGIATLIRAAALAGIHDPMFVIGMIEERFDETISWQQQLDAVAQMIKQAAPVLRECQSRFILKTHEEITTTEVVDLVKHVGEDLLGVAYDPVNVVCRMENPVAAARRVAPYVHSLYIDDCIVRFQDGGIRRFLAPLGQGYIDWPAITALMPDARRWLEMHRGQFAMPVFDQGWLAAQPEIKLEEYASVLEMAARFGNQEVPWDQAAHTERLPQALQQFVLQ